MSRKNFKSTGLALVGLGAFLVLLGIIFVISTALRRADSRNAIKKAEQDCIKSIEALKLEASLSNDEITVTKKDISNGTLALSQSSTAINSCPGWVLSRFCMGSSCETPGLQFVLKRTPAK